MSKAKVVDTDQVFTFIEEFITKKSESPTLREIQDGLKIKSTATVAYHVNKLIENGLIEKTARAFRSITLKKVG